MFSISVVVYVVIQDSLADQPIRLKGHFLAKSNLSYPILCVIFVHSMSVTSCVQFSYSNWCMKIFQHRKFPNLQCIILIRLTAVRAQVVLEKEKDAHDIQQLSNVCVYILYGSNVLCVQPFIFICGVYAGVY